MFFGLVVIKNHEEDDEKDKERYDRESYDKNPPHGPEPLFKHLLDGPRAILKPPSIVQRQADEHQSQVKNQLYRRPDRNVDDERCW